MTAETSTEKKLVEELLETKRRFDLALTAAGAGAWEWNIKTNQTYWSEGNYALLGLPVGSGEASYEEWFARVRPEDRDFAREQVETAVRDKSDLDFEYRAVWPDGTTRWIRDIGKMMLDADGGPIGMYGIQIDVTEKRTLEASLQESMRLEALGRIAAAVAHDFNNLLTVISGHAELMQCELSSQEDASSITEILHSVGRAAELTNQLLAFGRRQALRFEVVDVNTQIRALEGLIQPIFGESVEFVTDLESGLLLVRADRGQLEQVLLNLAVNARDAMPNGGRVLLKSETVQLEGDPAAHVAISIQDTGVGMDNQTIERVFEPFFTTKVQGKGSGLGLASAYGIVRQSGGDIAVESTLGQGSKFTVYLPRAEDEAPVTKAVAKPVADEDRGGTIMVVEDSAPIRRLVRTVLTSRGYEVITASSAEEALESLPPPVRPIDVLVTDVVLPGMGGPELAERVRLFHPTAAALFMSGYSDRTFVSRDSSGKPPAFLAKPFSHEDLIQKVRAALA